MRWSYGRLGWLVTVWQNLLSTISNHPLSGVLAAFAAGVIFWGAFNWSIEA